MWLVPFSLEVPSPSFSSIPSSLGISGPALQPVSHCLRLSYLQHLEHKRSGIIQLRITQISTHDTLDGPAVDPPPGLYHRIRGTASRLTIVSFHVFNFLKRKSKFIDSVFSTELLESSTFGEDGRKIDLDIRSSKSAILPESENYTDPVIQCIKERASKFQGHVPLDHMEPLQVVHYSANEYYHTHYDAFEHDDLGEINRETSFFLIIQESDVIGGGTNFPRIHTDCEWPPAGLCEHLECACSEGGKNTTLTVKPVQGNGIFWQNLRPDGSIHPRTLHAGLKLEAGVKVGLNIWTWSASLQ